MCVYVCVCVCARSSVLGPDTTLLGPDTLFWNTVMFLISDRGVTAEWQYQYLRNNLGCKTIQFSLQKQEQCYPVGTL